jgi:hypothetical protein
MRSRGQREFNPSAPHRLFNQGDQTMKSQFQPQLVVRSALSLAGLVTTALPARGNDLCDQIQVVASDAVAEDHGGWSVAAASGSIFLNAIYETDPQGGGSGSSYVFQKVNGNWQQTQKIKPSNLDAGSEFGFACDASGTRAIFGCPFATVSSLNDGRAYFYRLVGDTWTGMQTVSAPDGEEHDLFGYSAAVDSQWAVIGAPDKDGLFGGSVAGGWYIYRWVTDHWVLSDQSGVQGGGDRAGLSVDLHADGTGTRMVIGAPGVPALNMSGKAIRMHVFNNTWTVDPDLVATDAEPGDQFGAAVAVSGQFSFVGAPGDDSSLFVNHGSVYVFQGSQQVAKISGSVLSGSARFGSQVRIDGPHLIIGDALGNVYRYRWRAGEALLEAHITPPSGASGAFGRSLAVSEGMIVIGDPENADFLSLNVGAAYIRGFGDGVGSDVCTGAAPAGQGTTEGCTEFATTDGLSNCSFLNASKDVWHRLTLPFGTTGLWRIDTGGSDFDTVLSIHWACPGNPSNSIGCNSDFGGTTTSRIVLDVQTNLGYQIRVAGQNGEFGHYKLNIQPHCAADVAPVPSGDQTVNISDLLTVISSWGQGGASSAGDVNGSGTTDIADLLAVIAAWGACP